MSYWGLGTNKIDSCAEYSNKNNRRNQKQQCNFNLGKSCKIFEFFKERILIQTIVIRERFLLTEHNRVSGIFSQESQLIYQFFILLQKSIIQDANDFAGL